MVLKTLINDGKMDNKSNMFVKSYLRRAHQGGWGLLEIVAAIAIVGVVVAGSLALWDSAKTSETAVALSQDLISLRGSVQQLFAASGNYGNAGTQLNGVLINARKIPADINIVGTQLFHKEDGNVVITAQGRSFDIRLDHISRGVCIGLLSNAGSAWTRIVAGSNSFTSFPVSPVQAEGVCTSDDNNIITFTAS